MAFHSYFSKLTRASRRPRSVAGSILLAVSIFVACGTSQENPTDRSSGDGGGPDPSGNGRDDGGGAGGEAAAPVMSASVSQFGMTWVFDGPHPVGQFVNGDYWVVGPVTIVSVSPAPTAGRNGSVVNPPIHDGQSYDSRGYDYTEKNRATFPLHLSGISSLVSSISHETSNCTLGGEPAYKTYNGDCQWGPVATQAVLTVVSTPPAPGTFRPPYAGSAVKPLYSASRIDWSVLPKLPKPRSAPTDDAVLRHVERPWIDHMLTWTLQRSCATLNMFCYGREIGDAVQEVALYTLLDTPAQKQLATRFIQLGIDNYGIVKNGINWGMECGGFGNCGGHMNGRKMPIVFAGVLLNDAGMKSPGDISGEDLQTYYGAGHKALWGAPCTACYMGNGCKYSGTCTNGAKDCRDTQEKLDGCEDYRNCCTSLVWPGQALTALALHAKGGWNHDAFFDYVDRWMGGDVPGGGDSNTAFAKDMWTQYRNSLP